MVVYLIPLPYAFIKHMGYTHTNTFISGQINSSNPISHPGYAPDPIAEWKKRASKIKGLTSQEDDADAESEDEPEPEDKTKSVDPGTL